MSMSVLRCLAVVLAVLAVASCRGATVYNVEKASLTTTKPASTAQIEAAIKRAGASLGWQLKQVSPGHMEGRLPVRSHIAVADIYYTAKDFSIKYKDSSNLNYDASANTIHANYNGWVQNFEKAIIAQAGSL
jgi:hypothetical protein